MLEPPKNIESIISESAQLNNVPIEIARSVAYVESRYNPAVTSKAGAKGLFQLMPVNIKAFGVTDPYDPTESANAGTALLAKLYKRFGSWSVALAAYNWGSGNVRRRPSPTSWPTQVRKYVEKVLKGAGYPVPFYLRHLKLVPKKETKA